MNKWGSISVIRTHLFKFLHRYLNEQPDLRDRLAGEICLTTISQARDLLNDMEARYSLLSDDELEAHRSSSPEASWYRRHRQPDRRVHQTEIRVLSALSPLTLKEKTVDERKRLMQERIKRLKEQKKERLEKGSRFLA
jgi:hypothetical protein